MQAFHQDVEMVLILILLMWLIPYHLPGLGSRHEHGTSLPLNWLENSDGSEIENMPIDFSCTNNELDYVQDTYTWAGLYWYQWTLCFVAEFYYVCKFSIFSCRHLLAVIVEKFCHWCPYLMPMCSYQLTTMQLRLVTNRFMYLWSRTSPQTAFLWK